MSTKSVSSNIEVHTVQEVVFSPNGETTIWELEEFLTALRTAGADENHAIEVIAASPVQMIWREEP